jgi:hypothetical protein
VYQYEIVSPKTGQLIALVTPWLELSIGICFIGGVFLSGTWAGASLLLSIFALAQYSVIHRGLRVACGCFAVGAPDQITYLTLARTAGLAAVALLGTYLFFRSRRVEDR